MSRPRNPQVVTGNALVSGRVLWLAANGGWVRELRLAQVFHDPEAAEAALARAGAPGSPVVGCYLAEVRVTPQGPEPLHFREALRAAGPSAAARIPG
jgi:hypothetical protein